MEDHQSPVADNPAPRRPWNKGKLVGAKPPLRPSHVWSIRTKLQMQGRQRDLALFNLAIDSKLRGCDVVAVRVDDVAPSGYAMDRATIRQRKIGRPVRFELTDQTRIAIDEYLRLTGRKVGQFLFAGRGNGEGKLEMSALRAADVIKFVQRQVAHRSRGSARKLTTGLRSFLRFARYRGYITADLATGVPVTNSRVTNTQVSSIRESLAQNLATIEKPNMSTAKMPTP